MRRRRETIIAYNINGIQPVVCSTIGDNPYFYSSMSPEDLAREIMHETRDILIEAREMILS